MSERDEIVCDNCGERACWEGVLMCEGARMAGTCTRAEFEQRHPSEPMALCVVCGEPTSTPQRLVSQHGNDGVVHEGCAR